jgi:hypothetical protein
VIEGEDQVLVEGGVVWFGIGATRMGGKNGLSCRCCSTFMRMEGVFFFYSTPCPVLRCAAIGFVPAARPAKQADGLS